MAVVRMLHPIPDPPADLPALLSPASSLGPHARLRLLERWTNDLRVRLFAPGQGPEQLAGIARDIQQLVTAAAHATVVIKMDIEPDGGGDTFGAALRCAVAGKCCELADARAAEAAGIVRDTARPHMRFPADVALWLLGHAIRDLRAALRLQDGH